MRYKTTVTIEVLTDDPYDPGSIQDIANEVENEFGEGSLVDVTCVAVEEEDEETPHYRIIRVDQGAVTLWHRIFQDDYGVILQVFPFQPDHNTPVWKAIAQVGTHCNGTKLEAHIWDKEAIQPGYEPRDCVEIYPDVSHI